jgi:hypothetical protein
MSNQSWEEFGKLPMEKVRDEAIEQWDMIIDGRMKGKTAERAHRDLQILSPEGRDVLTRLVPAIVDTTLHHLMWTIEQHEEVSLRMADGPELRTISDGLAGDLNLWRERFSKLRFYAGP